MRRVAIERIKGNERLARPIYTSNDMILLSQGVQMKVSYVNRLRDLGIDYIFIEDELSKGVEVEDFIEEQTRSKCKSEVKTILEKYSSQGKIEIDSLVSIAWDIIDDIFKQKNIIVNVTDIRRKDEYIYAHSVNVCALSVLMAIKSGYPRNRIKDIAIGSLLHDIGKMLIPEEILNKEEPLTSKEKKILHQHPLIGYEAVQDATWLSPTAKVIILTHHERIDGSGYPFGWKGDKINKAVKIVSICDVFDAMSSDHVSRKAYKTYEIIEFLTAMKGKLFDAHLTDLFISSIAIYPSGTGVITSDKSKAIVLRQNKELPTRPVIRLLTDPYGNSITEWKELDLSKDMTTFIIDVFEV